MNQKSRKLLTSIDKISMVMSLMMLTAGNQFLFLSVIAYPTSLLFLLIYWKKTIWTVSQEKLIWVYLLFLVISPSWSADFGASLYMTLKLIGTLLIGISFTVRYTPEEQLNILAWTFGICAFLSFIWGLFLPQGIMEGSLDGSWSGIYGHKNHLGRLMVVSTILFCIRTIDLSRPVWLTRLCLAISLTLVVLSDSKTALVVLLTLLILLPLYRALRWSYSWIIPSAIILILSASIGSLFLVSQLENIVTALGKDITLTGRIPLWNLLIGKIAERPWFGYGYGGFWLGWGGESADVYRLTNWEPPHSHNGFIDLLLALGIIGLVIATLTFVAILLRSLFYLRSTKSASGLWPLMYITLLFLVNVTESNLNAFSMYWALSIIVAISTHRKMIIQDFDRVS